MIWHIFKKDWKLLWPFVLTVAALQILNAVIHLILGHFLEPRDIAQISSLFPMAVRLGIAALIVTAVHQDTLPGDRQDWLVRPIRRRDVILAKLLFILAAVHGPMLLADLGQGLATGFSFWNSLSAALARNVFVLLAISTPVLALASMTATIMEFIGSVLAIFLVIVVFIVSIDAREIPVTTGGIAWMMFAFWSALGLVAAAIIVPLQYFRRATMRARIVAIVAVLLVPMPAFLPWTPAFAFQQWFSAEPNAAKAIGVAFDPSLGKLVLGPNSQNRANSVWLPLRVSGLTSDSIVISDHANVRIIGRDGSTIFSGRATGNPQVTGDPGVGPFHIDDFPVRTTAGGDVRTHELITLPGKIYEFVRSQPIRLELDYSLTLFHIEASNNIAALNGDNRTANIGWCETRLDYNGNRVELGCIKPGIPPFCATFVLKNTVTGMQNPASNPCLLDYTPYATDFQGSAMTQFGGVLSVRDPRGFEIYPVDASQLPAAQVSIKIYKPITHFTRQLIIPEIRLGDWDADLARQQE